MPGCGPCASYHRPSRIIRLRLAEDTAEDTAEAAADCIAVADRTVVEDSILEEEHLVGNMVAEPGCHRQSQTSEAVAVGAVPGSSAVRTGAPAPVLVIPVAGRIGLHQPCDLAPAGLGGPSDSSW